MKSKNFLSGFLTIGVLMSGHVFGMDADWGAAPRPGIVAPQVSLDANDQVNISKALVRAGFARMMTSPEERLNLVSQYQKQVNGHQFFYVNVNGTTKITHDGANWVLVSHQPPQSFMGASFTPPTASQFPVILPPMVAPMATRPVAHEGHFAGAQMQPQPFLPDMGPMSGHPATHQAPLPTKEGIFQALLEAGLAAECGVGSINPDYCASLFSSVLVLPGQTVYSLRENSEISVVYEDVSSTWELRGPPANVLNNITGQMEFKSHTQVTVTHSSFPQTQGQLQFSILYSTVLPSNRNVTLKEAHIFDAFKKGGFASDNKLYGLTPKHSARGFRDFNSQSYQHYSDPSIHVFQEQGEWTLARILPNGQRVLPSKIEPDFRIGGFLLTF